MRAMILAAGFGKRLKPLTDKTPKPLIEVAGKPLIIYHIERLAAAGITELVINVSYLAQQIIHKLGDGRQFGVNITYSMEEEPLEVAGGIIQALPLLGGKPFLTVNSDIWTDYPFQQLFEHAKHFNKAAHLVLANTTSTHPTGDFGLNGAHLLETAHVKYVYSGIALYSPRFFMHEKPGKQTLLPLLKKAIIADTISAEHYAGEWQDVGNLAGLQQLNERLHGRTH